MSNSFNPVVSDDSAVTVIANRESEVALLEICVPEELKPELIHE